MKRIFVVVILLATSIAVFAQQANRTSTRPTSDQTRENAKQYLEQARSASQKYNETQSDLNARNVGNDDERRFNQIKAEIERLEVLIATEQYKISTTLDKGVKVSRETLDNVSRLLDQHKQKLAELEAFSSGTK